MTMSRDSALQAAPRVVLRWAFVCFLQHSARQQSGFLPQLNPAVKLAVKLQTVFICALACLSCAACCAGLENSSPAELWCINLCEGLGAS
jgi:hypothetical protein